MVIKINLKIFIFIAVFYFTKQINIYFCLMLFAFIHELGHLLAGVLVGFKPKSLTIMPLGISINFNIITINNINIKKLIIALAGPITNLLVILITYVLKTELYKITYQEIIYSNLLIFLFNLIPLYPLDGGRILKYGLHIKYGIKQSVILTNKISNIIIIVLTGVSLIATYYLQNIAIIFIQVYLWFIMLLENKKFKLKKRIFDLTENYLN